MKFNFLKAGLILAAAFSSMQGAAAQEIEYKTPNKEAVEMILAQPVPKATFNRTMTVGLTYWKTNPYANLADMAAINEFKVAGLRLNGDNFSQTRKDTYDNIELINALTGAKTKIAGLPEGLKAHDFKWSPEGKYICFLNDTKNEVELYRIDVTAAEPAAVKINANPVNTIYCSYAFMDEETIIYKSVPADLGAFPAASLPKGPIVQESFGKRDSYRTTQDLLKSPYDEAVYEYLATSIFSIFDGTNTRTIGQKGIIRGFDLSPDGKYMMVQTTHRPFNYAKSSSSFPSKNEIWSTSGEVVKVLKGLPKKPSTEGGKKPAAAPKGPKKPAKSEYAWRLDKGAVLTWVETAAEENAKEDEKPAPDADAEKKDDEKPERTYFTSIYQCEAPFDLDKDKQLVLTTEYRFGRIIWGNDHLAIYTDASSKQKIRRSFAFDPSDKSVKPTLLLTEDTSLDTLGNRPVIGRPVTERGTGLLKTDAKGTYILLTGDNRPDENGDNMSFIDKMSLKDGKIENVWTAKAPFKETVSGITHCDSKTVKFITVKESPVDVPNYVAKEVKRNKVKETPITAFVNNIPHYDRIRSEYITYKRADGVNCAARVFVPADWDKERDGKLPVFMWTYPYEHRTVVSAERNNRADRYSFVVPDRNRQVFWCLSGYAVVLQFSMPIIAEKNGGQPNNVFKKNLVMNAEAIINALDDAGIGDRNRMSVGGHSYGGFMTGNLLCHTRLYKAGIANSGAYNRSLTPYGFQSEGRDYWKAQKMYQEMSPYNYADKVKDAILLTHGQMDENTGTHPIQSERFYYAIAGHNGKAKWLQLPYEGHKYAFKENLLHYFYEVETMLNTYVKNAKPAEQKKAND